MFRPLIEFARRHIILFRTAKFLAGLVIGFGLGVYFLADPEGRGLWRIHHRGAAFLSFLFEGSMNNLPSRLSIPAPDGITLDDIIAMYEALRPFAPSAGAAIPATR